jgi:hypothetical protein
MIPLLSGKLMVWTEDISLQACGWVLLGKWLPDMAGYCWTNSCQTWLGVAGQMAARHGWAFLGKWLSDMACYCWANSCHTF